MTTIDWNSVSAWVPPVPPDAHKYTRGLAAIYAGSEGAAGAARIAAAGAQAAGAGLVRLYVDAALYPIIAGSICAGSPGIMVAPCDTVTADPQTGRFHADALLLGPGWGSGEDRQPLFDKACAMEGEGTPLVLDADALTLAKGRSFTGRTILTPHTGEAARLLDVETKKLLKDPRPFILEAAEKMQAVFLYKAANMYIAAPDGRLACVEGRTPVLAAGGSGDLLAGITVALATRTARAAAFDPWRTACVAAALLHATALQAGKAFLDPLALSRITASLAGHAWL